MKLTQNQRNEILGILKARFAHNQMRHPDLTWPEIHGRLESNEAALWSLYEMERTGGEPDVILYEEQEDLYHFYDCSEESPKGRRSVCYDRKALESRKENKPHHSAVELAAEMGIEILTEEQYRELQKHGTFDTKTSSWVKTPEEVRALGGAMFCDRRYNRVFTYHNGAESYYAARGFRGLLRV